MCPLLGTRPATQAYALDWVSNQRPFGSQDSTQSSEPHQPGLICHFSRWRVLKWTLSTQVMESRVKGYFRCSPVSVWEPLTSVCSFFQRTRSAWVGYALPRMQRHSPFRAVRGGTWLLGEFYLVILPTKWEFRFLYLSTCSVLVVFTYLGDTGIAWKHF